MKDQLKAHLILITSTLIAGFNFTISKLVMPEFIQPSAIIVIRVFIAALFFIILHFLTIKEPVKKGDLIRIFPCALFGIAINQLLFYEGLNLTTPINAALMMTTAPILVLTISAILIKEKITINKIAGISLGAIGAISILLHSGQTAGKLFTGDLLVLTNAVSWAIFLVIAKPLLQRYHALTIIKWMFIMGFFMVFPFGINNVIDIQWADMPGFALLSLGFIVVFATIFAYILNVGALRYVNPSVAGTYIYFQPALASLIAVFFGQDELTKEKIFFSLLILGGIYLVSRKKPRIKN
ncbi:MAG: DMT family transporter [Cytophagaceae bacterium]